MLSRANNRDDMTAAVEIEEYDALLFTVGADGIWRAYDDYGLVAHAPTWRELYERTGGRWN